MNRVLMVVNPDLIAGKRMMTVRSMVTALDKECELFLLPISEIDFRNGTFTAYKRIAGGKFRKHKNISPEADLWIVYTDGYYLDHEVLGYRRRIDYFNNQLSFYHSLLDDRLVSQVVNHPDAERRTLKDWLATLDCGKLGIIPTFTVRNAAELRDLHRKHGTLVAKPNWGGGSLSVHLLDSEEKLLGAPGTGPAFSDYAFQTFTTGPEKRLWFTGNEFAGGRIVYDRITPWDPVDRSRGESYNSGKQFRRDLETARNVWSLSGLQIGSVDFIGDQVNELNGCGTTFIYYQGWTKVMDARPQLVRYLLSLL